MASTIIQYPGVASGEKPMGPAPISPALKRGPFLYVSGQVGIDPATGKVVSDDIEGQTRQTLENLKSLVEAAGMTLADVVKTNVFVTDVNDFAAMNAVYKEYFGEPYPARSTVGIALANDALLVEIEAVAIDPEAFK
jgi:2-iminobutanoate/2-iminopropanoate deaminase